MWRLLPIMAVLLVACGGGSAPPAPLASSAITSEAIGVAPGSPATWAGVVLLNRGAAPLTLQAIEPVEVDAGLRMIEVQVRVLGADGDASGDPNPSVSGPGFPPAHVGSAVDGTVVDPVVAADERPLAEVLVGLVADRPGRYVLRGLRVRYVVGGAEREGTLAHAVAICATDPGDQAGICTPP
jgi:hypothetical protein